MASPGFTDVFAALAAVVNTKFPEIGDLLLRRIVLQFRRAWKRNDKPQLLAAVKFIAHLVNQQVAYELIALELAMLTLENVTDDSIEVGIFERFRGILHEGHIDQRAEYQIESLFAIRKTNFQDHPAVRPELDLVEEEDQFTHEVYLDDEIDPETSLDTFKPDPNFLENERRYKELKKSILGEESEDDDGSDSESGDDEDDDEDEEAKEERMRIQDKTETKLVNLCRTIYLTIISSVDFEAAGHKLLKIKLEPQQEYADKVYQDNFEKCFVQHYSMIHHLETNKLRKVAKFFAHLLGTNALPWHVLAYIRLTEDDTTSSSRIFIKTLFQEFAEHLGIRLLNERLSDPSMQDTFEAIFPKDSTKNTRFSIYFFTSIGLGSITENLREYLKNMLKLTMQQQNPAPADEPESSESGSSDSESASESSDSEDAGKGVVNIEDLYSSNAAACRLRCYPGVEVLASYWQRDESNFGHEVPGGEHFR
ncbi:Pre-mRNA-splicing factor CWC22-like protein [Drosera capensis]